MRFRNRSEAGTILGELLGSYRGRSDVLVLGLPRGGVPVAYEVARVLQAPLDIFIVRKLGVPGQEELAMGAIASGGIRTLNSSLLQDVNIPPEEIEKAIAREENELTRQEHLYRGDRASPDVTGRTIIVVDDGLATGSTMRAAIAALRLQNPARIVVAVPTAAADICEELRKEADEVVCAMTPEPFHAVSLWYDDFTQTSDAEVAHLLMHRVS